ncbi:uncharacterized protein LOC131606050 [Vicia villosa]|uniref:uncharacterized protein LOC131606050 n=1 Tax=Vicia villosa TaxID=3911 RepID=UPI00273AB2F4|nr:uncharacterized protein LOC131606050 [Vicia villosa]
MLFESKKKLSIEMRVKKSNPQGTIDPVGGTLLKLGSDDVNWSESKGLYLPNWTSAENGLFPSYEPQDDDPKSDEPQDDDPKSDEQQSEGSKIICLVDFDKKSWEVKHIVEKSKDVFNLGSDWGKFLIDFICLFLFVFLFLDINEFHVLSSRVFPSYEPQDDDPKSDEPQEDDPKYDEPQDDDPKSDEPQFKVKEYPDKTETFEREGEDNDPKSDEPHEDDPMYDEPQAEGSKIIHLVDFDKKSREVKYVVQKSKDIFKLGSGWGKFVNDNNLTQGDTSEGSKIIRIVDFDKKSREVKHMVQKSKDIFKLGSGWGKSVNDNKLTQGDTIEFLLHPNILFESKNKLSIEMRVTKPNPQGTIDPVGVTLLMLGSDDVNWSESKGQYLPNWTSAENGVFPSYEPHDDNLKFDEPQDDDPKFDEPQSEGSKIIRLVDFDKKSREV